MYDNLFDSIQGTTWYHRYNGDRIVVKEILMDMGGTMQYVVETSNGGRRTIDATVLNDYIQSSTPINPSDISHPKQKIEFGEFYDSTMMVDNDNKKEPFKLPTTRIDVGNLSELTPTKTEQPKTSNWDIIHRALKRCSVPRVENKYIWDDFPQKEIDMLVDIMDISENEIQEYLTSEVFIDECVGDIREDLRDFIRCKIKRVDVTTTQNNVDNTPVEVLNTETDQNEIF